jgi:hypothetical protein
MNKLGRGVVCSLIFGITLMVPGAIWAQVMHPEGGIIYDDSQVPRIDITMSGSDLESLYADPYSDQEYRVQLRFTSGENSEEVPDVGISLRGNTSLDKEKKSFQLSFNSYEAGRDFRGIEKLNLNAETNDPSMVRSKLSWELFRFLGIPSARSNHVLLYINDNFYGVYINTEHIDEKFVRSRFGTNDGNLYKCLWPADLVYLGGDQDDYKSEVGDRRAYTLLINEEWDDYGDLLGLISVLNQYSGVQLMEEVEKVINVQQYLKIMAVDVMIGNWDGYIGNRNNYYLYRDPVTGRMEYLPYDLDNTWGIDWLGEDWAIRPVYNWHLGERPLYEKILEQETYKEQYTGYLRLIAGWMTSPGVEQEVERWRSQISGWVAQDPYYPLDWDYTFSDFENALTVGRGEHLWYGVLEYASLRAASALGQCIQADAPPMVSHARVKPSAGTISVDWTVEDDAPGFTTMVHYRVDEGEWQHVTPRWPPVTDPVSGILSYRDSLTGLATNTRVDLYFTARDKGMQEIRYPAGQITVAYPLVSGPLRINEFMASNAASVSDPYGEYDDWVEIHNPSSDAVWMGDLFLSDNLGDPGKYRFPDRTIGPGGYFLVWLDGQPEQGEEHASFRISQDGEVIRLSGSPSGGFTIMDSISFGLQVTDVAIGRIADGGSGWMAFASPTPGFSNLSTGSEQWIAGHGLLQVYPNPVTGGILHITGSNNGIILDITGNVVMHLADCGEADVRGLPSGIYLYRAMTGESVRFIIAGP